MAYFAECPNIRDRDHVSSLQEELIQGLQTQMLSHHPNDSGLFPRLLMIISCLRELSVEHKRMLATIKERPEFSQELNRQLFGTIE